MGTSRADLQGKTQVDENGSYYERGFFPTCFEVANHFGHAVGYLDEIGALEEDIQKWTNRPLDSRKSCSAGGRTYRLKEGCTLSFICTTNPIEYAGVNNLTEDLLDQNGNILQQKRLKRLLIGLIFLLIL